MRYMYQADGDRGLRMIAAAGVPERVRRVLDNQPIGTVFDTDPQPVPTDKACIFCGEAGTEQRFVHMQMVSLCQEDYDNRTTGEVGSKVKELQHAKEEEKANA